MPDILHSRVFRPSQPQRHRPTDLKPIEWSHLFTCRGGWAVTSVVGRPHVPHRIRLASGHARLLGRFRIPRHSPLCCGTPNGPVHSGGPSAEPQTERGGCPRMFFDRDMPDRAQPGGMQLSSKPSLTWPRPRTRPASAREGVTTLPMVKFATVCSSPFRLETCQLSHDLESNSPDALAVRRLHSAVAVIRKAGSLNAQRDFIDRAEAHKFTSRR